ncbi:unnamed protein product [Amoebophrya sp. A120]|nr:unnamed protein product [Amoebophrya sp. A120]|eukprot:GSA120T00007554001.1
MVRTGHFFSDSLSKEKATRGPCFSYRQVSMCHPLKASKGETAGFGNYAGATFHAVELPSQLAFEIHPTENDTWLPQANLPPKKTRKRVSRYSTKAVPTKLDPSSVERMLAFCAGKVARGEDKEEVYHVHITKENAVVWGAGPTQSPTLVQLITGLVGKQKQKLLKLRDVISNSKAQDEERSPFYTRDSSLSFKFLSRTLQFLRAILLKDMEELGKMLSKKQLEMDQCGEYYEGFQNCLDWFRAHLVQSTKGHSLFDLPNTYRFPAIHCIDVAHRCVNYRFECLIPNQECVGVQVLHFDRKLMVSKIQTIYHKLPQQIVQMPLTTHSSEDGFYPPGEQDHQRRARRVSTSAKEEAPLPGAVAESEAQPAEEEQADEIDDVNKLDDTERPILLYFEDADLPMAKTTETFLQLADAKQKLGQLDVYKMSAGTRLEPEEIVALKTRLENFSASILCVMNTSNKPLVSHFEEDIVANCFPEFFQHYYNFCSKNLFQDYNDTGADASSSTMLPLADSIYPGLVVCKLSTELDLNTKFMVDVESEMKTQVQDFWDANVETSWTALHLTTAAEAAAPASTTGEQAEALAPAEQEAAEANANGNETTTSPQVDGEGLLSTTSLLDNIPKPRMVLSAVKSLSLPGESKIFTSGEELAAFLFAQHKSAAKTGEDLETFIPAEYCLQQEITGGKYLYADVMCKKQQAMFGVSKVFEVVNLYERIDIPNTSAAASACQLLKSIDGSSSEFENYKKELQFFLDQNSMFLFPLKLPNDGQCFALECRVDYDRPAGGSATESWPNVFLERLKPFCFHSFSDFSGMLGGASAEAEPTSPEDAASSKASQLVVLASAPTGNEEQDTSLTTLTCQLVYDLWQKRNNQQAEAGAEVAGTNGATSAQQVDEDAMLENEITFQSGGMNFAMQTEEEIMRELVMKMKQSIDEFDVEKDTEPIQFNATTAVRLRSIVPKSGGKRALVWEMAAM